MVSIFSVLLFFMDRIDYNILIGHFSLVHERFASEEHIMETNITVKEWKKQLENVLQVHMNYTFYMNYESVLEIC